MSVLPLAFRVFLDPITAIAPNIDEYWLWLSIPLVVAISLIYKGTRIEEIRKLPAAVTIMSMQVMIVMVAAAVGLFGLYWVLVRVI